MRTSLFVAALALPMGAAHAGSFDYIWNGGSGAWESQTGWTHNNPNLQPYPVNHVLDEAIVPNTGALTIVAANNFLGCRALRLNSAAAVVEIVTGGRITVGSGGLTGPGTVLINATAGSGPALLTFPLAPAARGAVAAVSISNATVAMIDNAGVPNSAQLVSSNSPIVVGPDAVIRGSGFLNAYLTNLGQVIADRPGERLTVQYETTNLSSMSAISGGVLALQSGPIHNAGSVIAADGAGSEVRLGSPTIDGGVLRAVNGGLLLNLPNGLSSISNAEIQGPFLVSGASGSVGYATFAGATLVLNGTMTVRSDGAPSSVASALFTPDAIVVSGSGEIVLDAPAGLETAASIYTGTNFVTFEPGVTIRGAGFFNAYTVNNSTISADVPGRSLIFSYDTRNRGTLRSAGGTLLLNAPIVQNETVPPGEIEAQSGLVRFTGGSVTGGSISGTTETVVIAAGTTLNGVTVNGGLTVKPGGFVALQSTFTNDGLVVVEGSNSATASIGAVLGTFTLGGQGEIRLAAAAGIPSTATIVSGSNTVIIGENQSVTGSGYFNAYIDNTGTIDPGTPGVAGTIRADYSLVNLATGEMVFNVYGGGPTECDRIFGVAPVTIQGGTLRVINSAPTPLPVGATYDVLTCGTLSGTFPTVIAPGFSVAYGPNYIRLTATPPLCGGADLNRDGIVNTTDLTLLLFRFGQTVEAGTTGDINSDGVVNTSDLTLLLVRFGQLCV